MINSVQSAPVREPHKLDTEDGKTVNPNLFAAVLNGSLDNAKSDRPASGTTNEPSDVCRTVGFMSGKTVKIADTQPVTGGQIGDIDAVTPGAAEVGPTESVSPEPYAARMDLLPDQSVIGQIGSEVGSISQVPGVLAGLKKTSAGSETTAIEIASPFADGEFEIILTSAVSGTRNGDMADGDSAFADQPEFEAPAKYSGAGPEGGEINLGQWQPRSNESSRPESLPVTPRAIESTLLDAYFKLSGGEKKTLRLRLTPSELGSVNVTVEKTADGRVSAHFQTDTRDAKAAIDSALNELRASLERVGIRVKGLEATCSFSSSTPDDRGNPNESSRAANVVQAIFNNDSRSTIAVRNDDQDRLVSIRA